MPYTPQFKNRKKNYPTIYAERSEHTEGERRHLKMHCVIMGKKLIDHRDRDGLNNQRLNLRAASVSQNSANQHKRLRVTSSIFKGVYWKKREGKWVARVKRDGVLYHIGYFRDEVDAATAYNFKTYELFGEFARMNVPLSGG